MESQAGTRSPTGQARPPFTLPSAGWRLGGVGWLPRGWGWGPLEGVSHRVLIQEAVVEVDEGLLELLGAQGAQHVRMQAAELGDTERDPSSSCPTQTALPLGKPRDANPLGSAP